MNRRSAAAVVTLAVVVAGAVSVAQPPQASQFTQALLRGPSGLLDESLRARIDEINRELRESESVLRNKNATAEERGQAEAKHADAEKQLAEAVGKIPTMVALAVADGRGTLSPGGPYNLPGDAGALLFRIGDGSGTPQFVAVQEDFSAHTGAIQIPFDPATTTWALLGLKNVPLGRTTTQLSFNPSGGEPILQYVDFMTPERGRLKLTVLSDDTADPTPAMVRLVWKVDGQVRKPGNGIDFNPQFDNQGNKSRVANLQGALRGEYWCVPGPFDMVVPSGEWEVTVRRGVEHTPITETFTVAPNETVEKTYRPRRWVDMRDQGWYSGDDHVHAQILGDADARNIMTWAKAEDVHLCNIVKMGDIHRTWFEQRGFGPDYRVVDGDYILCPGQECPRTHDELGHTLAMNITGMIRDTDRYFLYDLVFDQVHAQGGLTGYAHAGWGGFHVHRDMSMNVAKQKVDFVELLQFANIDTGLYYEFLNTGFKITASAGSDVPWGGTVGEVRIYAYTGKRGEFSADKWFEAVGKGHTFVSNGPMLEFRVGDAMPGDQIDIANDKPLKVTARAWGDTEGGRPVKVEVVRNGDAIKTVEPSSGDAMEVKFELDVETENGFWLALRAEGADGSKAHTTPVYVVRPGLRFWRFEDVDDLIARRRASLDEIETLVKDYTDKNGRGELANDRYKQQFAILGPQILERVQSARAIYDELKATADKERPLRGER